MWFLIFISINLFQVPPKKSVKGQGKPDSALKTSKEKSLSPDESLAKAKQESLQGNHPRVIVLLRPNLYPTSKFSSEEKEITALRLLGLSFWFKEDFKNAEQAFTVLLTRRPNFKLDPVVVPIGAIDFFKVIRKKLKHKLDEIRKFKKIEAAKKKKEEELARKKKLEELKMKAPILLKSTIIHKNYFIYTMFPMGIGQFQNGQNAKGWVFSAFQLMTGIISISAYTYLRYKYPKGLVPTHDVTSARQIQYLQVGSGLGFYTIWIIGVVDAIMNFKPTRTENFKKFVPRDKSKFKLFASPMPNGAMFGLSGEF